MKKVLNTIKKKRLDTNVDVIISYNCTATEVNGEWSYVKHELKPIFGNQLALDKKWSDCNGIISYDFIFFEDQGNGQFKESKSTTLAVMYAMEADTYYATLCIEKTVAEIRKEKIAKILSL